MPTLIDCEASMSTQIDTENGQALLTVRTADNIIIGDSGYIDWTAADNTGRIYADITTPDGGALPGDDNNAADIDRLFSTEPDHGGNDTITVGDGDDIIIGGEDGEIVNDAIIGELSITGTQERSVSEDVNGDGDTIDAGQGNNIVFGDNGQITAAAQDYSGLRRIANSNHTGFG